ncbi:MAG: hypothetical protein K1X88_14725 [Nannocystaceae bacterium]|nr:hypothetical protein [Nannocystaceae bacterium]
MTISADAARAEPTLPQSSTGAAAGTPTPEPATGGERRTSGRRGRARDRLLDRGSQPSVVPGELSRVRDIENTLLFIDDDLRETALAMTRIEDYLTRALQTLESPDVRREHVVALAQDAVVLDHLDALSETLESLRRRLGKLSSTMR